MQDLESLYAETFYNGADRINESSETKYIRAIEKHITNLESSIVRNLSRREANVWHSEMRFIKSGLQELLQLSQRKTQV